MMELGEPLLEYDVVTEGLEHWPRDVRLRQLQAHALLDSGATERAAAILQELQAEGQNDEETLGWLARTHKDLAASAPDRAAREIHLRDAAAAYLDAYRRTGKYWTGINAASMALLLGDKERAGALALEVRDLCIEELVALEQTGGNRYWPLATLGEAAVIQGEWSEAEEWYTQAAEAGRGKFGQLKTTRRQARLLIEYLGADAGAIDRCLRIPRVVLFAGHMVDRPDRTAPRFPPSLERAVQEAIRERLEKLDAGVGYASAACGSDLLFLEAILERGGEAHVVLPYDREQFREDSVEVISSADWGARYRSVLERATRVVPASEQRLEGSSLSCEYANLLLHGLASIHAAQLETELTPLTVWDGLPGDGPDGTASIVERWRKLRYVVEWINLTEIRQQGFPEPAAPRRGAAPRRRASSRAGASEFATRVMAMLFADAVGFSKLTEAEIPRFVQYFLGSVGQLLGAVRHAPVFRNTWGDGLYFVFADVRDAGLFALELRDLVSGTNWLEKGFSRNLSLRIGLHAGPVYQCTDPVTGRISYQGTHVSRAARIEPITPPNQVYASEPFAALAAAERASEFACQYVGMTPQAKGYGTFRTYHVHRRSRKDSSV
jgi:class 3 adenylate cyclase